MAREDFGYFEENQLLDGSISLLPLYSGLTIDLHVGIATILYQSFLWLQFAQAVHHLPNTNQASEIIAANNAPRCDKFKPDICVDDFEYPEQAIIDEIQNKRDVSELMYSEVKDNEPLVDGIPRDVEESYNYDYYYYNRSNLYRAASRMSPIQLAEASSSSSSSSPLGSNVDGTDALIGAITPQASPSSTSLSAQSPPTTGFICPSEVMYGKPKLAKNKKGLWKVIVNVGKFNQIVRLEK